MTENNLTIKKILHTENALSNDEALLTKPLKPAKAAPIKLMRLEDLYTGAKFLRSSSEWVIYLKGLKQSYCKSADGKDKEILSNQIMVEVSR